MSAKETLKNLEPNVIWKHFAQLCEIPRPSNYEQKVGDFVEAFGKNLGLKTIREKVGNVIIKKPATKGMENLRTVLLQGHLDMVPQKEKDSAHDFTKDPIDAYVDVELVKAHGTTLGADNGIGIATILSILESKDIPHGPIEALLTVNEENTQGGAQNLSKDLLHADILLNLDSEMDDEICIGCAGGVHTDITFSLIFEETPKESASLKLIVSGLYGGHSGCDIQIGRANAARILARILEETHAKLGVRIAELHVGTPVHNAIPRDAYALITLPEKNVTAFQSRVKEIEEELQVEYKDIEENIKISSETCEKISSVIEHEMQHKIIAAIDGCINGVQKMTHGMPNLPEVSTNLSYIKTEKDKMLILSMQRSPIISARDNAAQQVTAVFKMAGASIEHTHPYPGWLPNLNSPILKIVTKIYEEVCHEKPKIFATHGGLETGFISEKYPAMDMISFGPTIIDAHSPKEKVKIESVQKIWNLLLAVLKKIPKK